MTNVEPFEFDQFQLGRLTDSEARETKRLIYIQPFQEGVSMLRQKYKIRLPGSGAKVDDVDLDQITPASLRDDLLALLRELGHRPRKWLLFFYIFVRFGMITRPYKSHPSFAKLPTVRKEAAQKRLPEPPDPSQCEIAVDQQFAHWYGELVDNNSTVAVRGGANHAALFLTADAMKEDVAPMLEVAMQYLSTLPARKRKKGERDRGADYDQLYEVAKCYRRGDTKPLAVQTALLLKHEKMLREQGWKVKDDSPETDRVEMEFRKANSKEAIRKRIALAQKLRFIVER